MIGYGNSMFLATHGILARSGGGGGASLLLDTYTGAAVAYSLRQLRTAYTGAAIRVRRSVDNAEQDIAFIGNDLDTQTMLDFVGYNLLTYSEDATQTTWIKINGTVTADATTAPDSTTTADKFVENTTNGSHSIKRSISGLVIGNEYNASMYIKKAERTKVVIRSNIAVGTNQTFELDLTTGTVTNNQFSNTPVISNEGNDWWRVSIQMTCGSTSGANAFEVFLSNGTTTSYAGDNVSGVYVWGSQISQTSTVKTYQKTVATAGGNGFVTTWYDQSGNANNATQATATNQCQIVSSGAVITDPNTGKISTTWTTDTYTISNITVTQTMLMSAVVNRTATNNTLFIFGSTASTPTFYAWGSTGNATTRISAETVTHESGYTTTGAYIMSALRDSSNIAKAWRNTTALTTGLASGGIGTGNFTRFGTTSATSMTARCVEAIFWDNDKESSRADIVTNQNDYWEVY